MKKLIILFIVLLTQSSCAQDNNGKEILEHRDDMYHYLSNEIYDKAFEISDILLEDYSDYTDIYPLAIGPYFMQGNWGEVSRIFQLYFDNFDTCITDMYEQGVEYNLRNGDLENACKICDKIKSCGQLYPASSFLDMMCSVSKSLKSDLDSLVATKDTASLVDGALAFMKDTTVFQNYTICILNRFDNEFPNHFAAKMLKGVYYDNNADSLKTIKYLTEAFKLKPEEPFINKLLADWYSDYGFHQDAFYYRYRAARFGDESIKKHMNERKMTDVLSEGIQEKLKEVYDTTNKENFIVLQYDDHQKTDNSILKHQPVIHLDIGDDTTLYIAFQYAKTASVGKIKVSKTIKGCNEAKKQGMFEGQEVEDCTINTVYWIFENTYNNGNGAYHGVISNYTKTIADGTKAEFIQLFFKDEKIGDDYWLGVRDKIN